MTIEQVKQAFKEKGYVLEKEVLPSPGTHGMVVMLFDHPKKKPFLMLGTPTNDPAEFDFSPWNPAL